MLSTPVPPPEERSPIPSRLDSVQLAPRPVPEILLQLWSVQFQQLSWLGAAGAGGVLALVQAGFFTERIGATVSMASFALAALVAVLGPLLLADGVATGRDIRRTVRVHIMAAVLLVGIGIGGVLTGGVVQVLTSPSPHARATR